MTPKHFCQFISFILIVTFASCGGTSKSGKTSASIPALLKNQNSYYYYLASSLERGEQRNEAANLLLQKALEKDQNSSLLMLDQAWIKASQADFETAEALTNRALKANPKSVDGLLVYGKLKAAQSQTREAIDYYQRALALDSQKLEIYKVMAREYMTLKESSRAQSILKQCVRKITDSRECREYLGVIQLQEKKYNEALASFQVILDLDPFNLTVLQTIGEIHLLKKDYDSAANVFKRLQQLDPTNLNHSIRLALIYYEQKDKDVAIQEFEKVAKVYPKSDRIRYYLGLLYIESKQDDLALENLDRVPKGSNFFADALQKMLAIYRERDQAGQAVELLERKIDEGKANSKYFNVKVSILLSEQLYEEAEKSLEKGLNKYEDDENLMFQKAILLDRTNRWDQAKVLLKDIVLVHPKSAKAYNYLGYTMLEKGENVDVAFGFIQKAIDLQPDDGHIMDSLGWAYFKKGDIKKALDWLKQALSEEPDEPTVLEHLGDVYLQLRNKRRARQYFERSLNVLLEEKKPSKMQLEQIESIQNKLGQF